MEKEQTCGKGLADSSPLPAKIGELIAALTDTLEAHMTALDPEDESSRREHEAYAQLATEYRRIAHELESTATKMLGLIPPNVCMVYAPRTTGESDLVVGLVAEALNFARGARA